MSGVNRIGNAFPTGGTVAAGTVRENLALGLANVIETADDIQDIDYSETDKTALPDVIIVRDTLVSYARDPADTTTAHDGVTTLVSADNKRFKTTLVPSAFVNVLGIVNVPTGSEVAGDRYIVGTSPTGAFASNASKLAYKNGAGDWVFATPAIGQAVYVRDVEGHYHWSEGGTWDSGIGLTSIAAGQVGARELAFPWGMAVESETATPPGTRATGGTPTMPLGGTAANINDDTAATTGVTSALGNLAAAGTAARAIAKIDLGADVALTAIEAKQLKASTGSSSSNAMGFYYASAAAPTTLIQLGAGFTLTASLQDFVRSGSFTARYLFLVTEAKDWSTATHTLGDFNGYKLATSIADGVKYIVAANGIGTFSGHDTEIAEAWDGAYRFYEPYDGARVFDRDTRNLQQFDSADGVWSPQTGAIRTGDLVQTRGGGDFTAVGSGFYSYSATPPTTSNAGARDDIGLTITAARAGARISFRYTALGAFAFDVQNQYVFNVALFRDSEPDAIDWRTFTVVAAATGGQSSRIAAVFNIETLDDDSRLYRVVVLSNFTNRTIGGLSDRLFEYDEYV